VPDGVMSKSPSFVWKARPTPTFEIQASIRRGMIGFPTTRLVKISTPYMRGGVLYEDFQSSFGQDDPDLLVWRASSRLMNPHDDHG
jgi:hypothetical protein